MRGRLKVWHRRMSGVFLAGFVGLIGYLVVLHYNGNFHVVVDGELYRSAQVKGDQLAEYTRQVGLKSVLNLRGASPRSSWYQDEMAESARLGLVHADFELSASRMVTNEEATQLIALMRTLPKPLLIHCKHGSDRTGLLSALYLAAVKGQDEETAEKQLSLYFGHFSVPYLSAAYAMDESWEQFEMSLEFAQN
jgi:protein tyrosine/serine phosphatase